MTSQSLNITEGMGFLVHQNTIHQSVFRNIAAGFKTPKLDFKVCFKDGFAELCAMAHFKTTVAQGLSSAAVCIVSDSVIRNQAKSEDYKKGVQDLMRLVSNF